MATGTFTAVGSSSDQYVAPLHGPLLVISGTFVATVVLEAKVSGAYVPIATVTSTQTISLPSQDGTYRLTCTAFTSGTVTYALTSRAQNQVEYRGPDGSIRLKVDSDGAVSADAAVIGASVPAAISPTLLNLSAESGLTAHAGGTQAAALALSAVCSIHNVTTVGTAADSVALPAAVVGQVHIIVNSAASNSMQVFGTTPDTINGVATATGVAQAAGLTGTYACAAAGKWFRVLSA